LPSSHAPVQYAQQAPVVYGQPRPIASQAPVAQSSTVQHIPANFVPVAQSSTVSKPTAPAVTTFKAPSGGYVAPTLAAPASSYVSPTSSVNQEARAASATYSVPSVIAQPPATTHLSSAAHVVPSVFGQTAPRVSPAPAVSYVAPSSSVSALAQTLPAGQSTYAARTVSPVRAVK
jgi:hypothetical protein